MEYSCLFHPLKTRTLSVKNRICMTAIHLNYCAETQGRPSEQFKRFYYARAEGGAGLITVGGCRFAPEGAVGLGFIRLEDDSYIEPWQVFIKEMHRRGTKVAVQLYHAGRYSRQSRMPDGMTALAPSAIYWLDAQLPGLLSGHHHHEGRAVAGLRGGSGGHLSILQEAGLQPGQGLHRGTGTDALVLRHHTGIALAVLPRHGDDLPLKQSLLPGLGRLPVAFHRHGVHLLPSDTIFLGHVLCRNAHGQIEVRMVLHQPGVRDEQIALDMLARLGISHLASSSYAGISGGERQMVLIARAMAQQAGIVIMDEPTANLDMGNQARVMDQVTRLRQEGYLIILSTHNPQQALSYADRVLALQNGVILAEGPPEQVITEALLEQIYGAPFKIYDIPQENGYLRKVCLPVQPIMSTV